MSLSGLFLLSSAISSEVSELSTCMVPEHVDVVSDIITSSKCVLRRCFGEVKLLPHSIGSGATIPLLLLLLLSPAFRPTTSVLLSSSIISTAGGMGGATSGIDRDSHASTDCSLAW
uniref:Putative secreted protein n=1 Tax=Anopheles triannulatus TaxID=58253 RepID=A0A2M4B4L6_9DIPT